jgi:hypothetical protein
MINKPSTKAVRGAAVAAIIAACGAVVFFCARNIERTAAAIQKNRELSATLLHKNDSYSTLAADLAKAEALRNRVALALIPADDALQFVAALESIALKHSIRQTLRFDSPAATEQPLVIGGKDLKSIAYTTTLEGNAFALASYLEDIEKLSYFFRIEDVSIGSPAGGWKDISNITIRATLFVTDPS